MTTGELTLTLSVIEALKSQGYTEAEIARMFGVSRQAVSWHVHNYGGSMTPRQLVLKHFPFKVPSELTRCSIYQRLRDHGEWFAAGHKAALSADRLQRLTWFYDKLRRNNWVIEYDPNIPPIEGVSKCGGWAYRERTPADEDYLVRVNEYTTLTEYGQEIWRFPDEEP
ncbi:XRE family transcriptional regulator [Mycolicibacterium houstonense]|uniref:XRE family transcriptional regulator n=1 Tax=Mycolicibacterium houstonense TaxID=146021 RepID=UPI000A70FE05|nr:XRE family transcriptional regulator [Mycolicibacterium houstonense]